MILDPELAAVVLVASIVSGVGSFMHGKRESRLKGGYFDCATEITLSLVAGFIVAFLGDAYEINPSIICACSLLASNNGAEFLAFSKSIFRKYIVDFMENKR
ncbi:hypothetical protein VXS06_14340 [Photobacterium toruni]|uniref:Holin n=1 Tax=Photobacterium toruni TaxID=1935446 RepID=A0ABU6L8N7_9GAMM|nr:hypothetical protein [Photobacterium toruni]